MTPQEKLDRDEVVCLEVFGSKFVAVVFSSPDHGLVANLRFGSGRHHTLVRPDLDRIVDHPSVQGVNVVDVSDAGGEL